MAEHQDVGLRSILRGQVCRTEWPFLSRRHVPSVIFHCQLDPKVHPPALCPTRPYRCALRPAAPQAELSSLPREMDGSPHPPLFSRMFRLLNSGRKSIWRASRWRSWAVIRNQNRVPAHKTPDVTEKGSSGCIRMQ